jgi:hypothetical protein
MMICRLVEVDQGERERIGDGAARTDPPGGSVTAFYKEVRAIGV